MSKENENIQEEEVTEMVAVENMEGETKPRLNLSPKAKKIGKGILIGLGGAALFVLGAVVGSKKSNSNNDEYDDVEYEVVDNDEN